jgi:RHS repeat-associated protein
MLHIATVVVLVAMSVEMAPPAAVAKAPKANPPAVKAHAPEKPSKAKAKATAKTAPPTKVASLSTAYGDTFDNHDGTFTASVSSGPINYRPSANAAWTPIDLTLSAISGGNGRVRAGKTGAPVEVGAPDDAAGFASVDTGAGKISLSLAPGAKPGRAGSKPVIGTNRADVAGLLPGTDLRVIPTTNGFRLFLTLAANPTIPSFTFTLNSPGLTPALQSDGTITFTDKNGKLAGTMPQPYAVDSTVDVRSGGGRFTDKVSYALATTGGKNLLTVNVDEAWLKSAIYPVYVDPSIVVSGTASVSDTFVDQAFPSSNFNGWVGPDGASQMDIGYDGVTVGGVKEVCYALVSFALPSDVMNSTIESATLGVYTYHGWVKTARTVSLYRVTSSWSVSGVKWTNKPSQTSITSQALAQGQTSSFDVASSVQLWAGGAANYGFELLTVNSDDTYWKRMYTTEHGANVPKLNITYSHPSATVTSPAANAWINRANSTLNWTYAANGGAGQAKYQVQIATNSTFSPVLSDSGLVASTASSYTIPSTLSLTDGTTYYYRVQVNDGTTWSAIGGAVGQFRWDSTAPVLPGPPTPPAQVDQAATSYTFSWSAATDGGSGVARYEVQAQSTSLASAGVCGSSWTQISDILITITSSTLTGLANNTCYRVGVRAIDNAGNGGSSSYSYSMPVLIDTTTSAGLGAPVVTDNCSVIGSCYRAGSIIYFKPSAAKTITLTSNGTDLISGIAASTFGPLTPTNPAGWTYTPATVPGNPASIQLTWSASAGNVSLSVTATDGAGVVSTATTISFTVDLGPEVEFATPVGGTITYIEPGSYTVAWTETQGQSPITARSLQRQVVSSTAGTCPANGWANDGVAVTTSSPVVSSGLLADKCYQWVQTLTDTAGPHSFTSSPILVDGTPPNAAITTPSANSVLRGTVVITGTAADDHWGATGSWKLEYGAGASPSSWTAIGDPRNTSVSNGSLGTWSTAGLTGLFTLKLTATDAAGNVTAATVTVDLDNTDRDTATVPFDMDGGWDLGVNVATGEASLARKLFSVPSFGPEQALSLAYNSADASAAGLFGPGWSSNLTQYLDLTNATTGGGVAVWHEADGTEVPFGSANGTTWIALAGSFETLSKVSTGYKITELDQSSFSFDANGKLTAITDRYGSALTVAPTASPISATDASGRVTTLTLTGGEITSVTYSDCVGTAVADWGCAHREQRTWGFGYTAAKLTSVTDPAGNITTLSYDGSGRLAGVSRPLTPVGTSTSSAVAWAWGYDTSGRVTSVTDPIGGSASPVARSTFDYTATTTVAHVVRDVSVPASPIIDTTSYAFDANGRVRTVVDADNWTTTDTYNDDGTLQAESRQIGGAIVATTSYTYQYGLIKTQTDPDGIVTTNEYITDNPFHDLTTKTVSGTNGTATLSSTTAYKYDSTHRLCRTIANPTVDLGPVTCTSAALTGHVDENVESRFSYTAGNQLSDQTNPLGVVSHHEYDTFGNELSVTENYVSGGAQNDSTNVKKIYTYDKATGNVLSETDPIEAGGSGVSAVSATKTYAYNYLGAGASEIDSGDSSIPSLKLQNTYDEFGNKIETDQSTCTAFGASCSTWALLNSVTMSIDPHTGVASVTTTTPATGDTPAVSSTTTTTYDLAGDGTKSVGPDGVATTNSYDGLGQLVEEDGLNGTTRHSFDGLGDETCTIGPATGDATTTTTSTSCTAVTGGVLVPPTDTTARTFDKAGKLLSEIDDVTGSPTTTTTTYDLLGRTATTTDPGQTVTSSGYGAIGRVILSVEGANATDTTFDRAGDVVKTTDPYDTSETGPAKTYTESAYDALGRTCRTVSAILDPLLDLSALADPCHTPITGTATTNLDTQTYLDAAGDPIAVVDQAGVVNRSLYNVHGQVWRTIANCVATGSTNPATCTDSGPHNSSTNIVTTNSYAASGGMLTSVTVTAGIENDTIYDGSGHVLASIVDKTGLALETDSHFDTSGRLVAQKSARGVVTINRYEDGRLAATTENCVDTIAPAHWYGCNGTGQYDGTANQTTTFSYWDTGTTRSRTSATGLTTEYTYDPDGHVLTQIDHYVAHYGATEPTINATTTNTYDTDGRAITSTAPNGAVTRTVYDTNGNVCRTIANATVDPTTLTNACTGDLPAGAQTANANIDKQFAYDASGHELAMSVPSPADPATPTTRVTTRYGYDAAGHLCRVIENATISSDDLAVLGEPCSDPLPDGTPIDSTQNVDTHYSYDDAGNMATQTVPADPSLSIAIATTTYHHDAIGRLSSQIDPDGNTTVFTYNTSGDKTSEATPGSDGGTIYFFYDTADRLCQRATLTPSAAAAYTAVEHTCTAISGATTDVVYSHDAAGNETGATDATTSSGESITATFDNLARPASITDTRSAASPPATVYSYASTNDGVATWGIFGRTDPSGTYSFDMDPYGRQTTLMDTNISHPSGDPFSWTYDADGVLACITAPTGNATSYAHDGLGRLASKTTIAGTNCGVGGSPYTYTLTPGYNAAGNMISSASTIGGDPAAGTTTYAYDALSRLTGYTPPTDPTNKSQVFAWNSMPDRAKIKTGTAPEITTTYDAASHPTGSSYTSDAAGAITTMPNPASGGTGTATLAWDILGRLSSVTAGTATTTYTYDPLDRLEKIVAPAYTKVFAYVGLTNSVARITTTGSTNSVTEVANDLNGTELYEYTDPAAPAYLESNGHGDVIFTTAESGAISGNAAYDPFGNLVAGSTLTTATRWQGSYQDDSSGLYYVIARWYAPSLGRFVSEDALTADAKTPQARNPYVYGAGDPVDKSDPTGQCSGPGGECFPEPLPCTTTSCSLNIATAGRVHEPYLWKDICGPGSLAVMLKFAIGDSKLQTYHPAKGAKIWGYATSESTKTKHLWKTNEVPSFPDGPYTDFMMWIATQVMTHPAGNGTGKSLATVASMTALIKKVGVGSYKYKNWSAKNTEKKMEYDVEHTIRSGIPAIVGTQMYLLPSQANFNKKSQHWVSVVAFDPHYYYYIDTCWTAELCGNAGSSAYDPYDVSGATAHLGSDPALAPKSANPNGNTNGTVFHAAGNDNPLSLAYRFDYPGTWRITKADMYRAISAYTSGGGWWLKT